MQNLIKAIGQYVKLNDQDIGYIEELFETKEIRKNDFFLKPGKICDNFAFVERGLLRHYIENDGGENTIFFSSENDFVCDYESFISKSVTRKGIIALEPVTLYTISYNKMQELYTKVSSGERFGRLYLETIFPTVINHIVSMHTDSAIERYSNFLKSFSHIQQRIPQYFIASFIGITPQSLSRIRKNLTKK